MTYRRHPFLQGNTASAVLNQPEIRGAVSKDSDGNFALPAPTASELVIETEDAATSGGISAVFSSATDTSIEYVLSQINTTLSGYATAVEYEGCIVIRSVGVGGDAYVRILQPISGFEDAASVLGFPVHPNPTATVTAGDELDTPVRPLQQSNPVGTKMLATGEDRVGHAYNRILRVLASNMDTLHSWLRRYIAVPLMVEIDETTHSAYISKDATTGDIEQINLAAVTAITPDSLGRFFIGGLTRDSSLSDIASIIVVTDRDDNELLAGDSVVRIGAVTRGQRTTTMPTFADDYAAAGTPLPDTTGVSTDGWNALGVERVKSTISISEIRQRTEVVCTGATFISDGVVAGDVGTITGATVSMPFNHNGAYVVDVVVSEEILILRPFPGGAHVRELNPDDSGVLGTLTVRSSGNFETDLWISFSPALPRFPEDGKIRLRLGYRQELGALDDDDILHSLRNSEEADGWTLLSLYRALTLEGAYAGMGKGGGFQASITHKPAIFVGKQADGQTAGTSERSSSDTATLNLVNFRLTIDGNTDRFYLEDVGRVIWLNATGLLVNEPWTVIKLIDGRTVELAPPLHKVGSEATSGVLSIDSWELREEARNDLQSVLQVLSPEYFSESTTRTPGLGYVFVREQRDEASTDASIPGLLSYMDLEKIRLHRDGTNITISVSPSVSGDTVELPFDPEDSSNFFAQNADTKTFGLHGSLTFCRILHGESAGFYRVQELTSAGGSGTNAVVLRTLKGATPSFASETDVSVSFYNAHFMVGAPISGGPESLVWTYAALSLYADSIDNDASSGWCARLAWRGVGGGIYAHVNDAEFVAYEAGDAANGPAIQLYLHAPADGIDVRIIGSDTGDDERRQGFGHRIGAYTNLHDLNINAPVAEGSEFGESFGLGVHQSGKDPAQVITKTDGDSSEQHADTGYSRLTPSAALLLGRAGTPTTATDWADGVTGRGSAAELRGSVWIYSDFGAVETGRPGWSGGGLFVEDVIGAGRHLYPSLGIYNPEDYPYYGVSPFAGWQLPTQLGSPGQVLPVSGSDLTGELELPDYGLFNMPHDAVLRIDDISAAGLDKPYARLIGHTVLITDHDPGTYTDVRYVIQAVRLVSVNEIVFSLARESTTPIVDPGSVDFRILGNRWWWSYIDIADYMHLGTAVETDERWKLPTLSIGRTMDQYQDKKDLTSGNIQASEGQHSIPELNPSQAGAGIGDTQALTSMTTFYALSGMGGGSWDPSKTTSADVGAPGEVYFTQEWGADNREACKPFPNMGIVASTERDATALDSAYLSVSNPGSLLAGDWTLEHVSQGTGNGVVAHYHRRLGGALRVITHASNTGSETDSIRLWRRPFRGSSSLIYGFRVRVIYEMSSTEAPGFTAAIRREDGTVLASTSVSGTDQLVELDWTVSKYDLEEARRTEFFGSIFSGEGLYLTIDIDVEAGAGQIWYFHSIRVESLTRAARVHAPLVVAGPITSTGLRYSSPVKGYCTRGPSDSQFLHPAPYGRNEANDGDGWTSGTGRAYGHQEGHGVGSWYDEFDTVWRQPVFRSSDVFRVGIHSAAVRGAYPYFDPLYYAQACARVTAAGGDVDSTYMQLPGRTGFLIPFDPPHGARISTLDVAVSSLPRWDPDHVTKPLFWGNWHSYPTQLGAGAFETDVSVWKSASNWDDAAGVKVVLWRYNTLPTHSSMPLHSAERTQATNVGFAEAILSQTIPFTDDDLPDVGDHVGTGTGATLLSEASFVRNWDLTKIVEEEGGGVQLLTVDRRQYSYFLTIEFWIGPRPRSLANYSYGDDDDLNQQNTDHEDSITQAWFVPTITPDFPLSTVGMRTPPVVKFRGARLGYVTDRASHGGWS